jgi:HSP20 family protein
MTVASKSPTELAPPSTEFGIARNLADIEKWMPGFGDAFATRWAPSLDVSETEHEYLIEAELPGVKIEDIEVEARDGTLRLSAKMQEQTETKEKRYLRQERRYGAYERTLALPEGVEAEKIRCEFTDGVLHCHLPKTEQAKAKTKGRKIAIEKK